MIFLKKQNSIQPVSSEDHFYEYLFIKNSSWNKPSPNDEESLRWNIVEKFMYYIVGYNTACSEKQELRILDVGCGRGWLSNLLNKYGRVTGIEPVKAVVEYAKKLFPFIDLQHATSEDLIKAGYTGSFDVLVCSEVIEHIKDEKKEEFAEVIQKLLKPNGFLIITTPRKEMLTEWLKYTKPGQPVEDWMEEIQLQKLFELQSFKKIFLERFSISPSKAAPYIPIYQLWLFQKYE